MHAETEESEWIAVMTVNGGRPAGGCAAVPSLYLWCATEIFGGKQCCSREIIHSTTGPPFMSGSAH